LFRQQIPLGTILAARQNAAMDRRDLNMIVGLATLIPAAVGFAFYGVIGAWFGLGVILGPVWYFLIYEKACEGDDWTNEKTAPRKKPSNSND
jgi:hypothetical protein